MRVGAYRVHGVVHFQDVGNKHGARQHNQAANNAPKCGCPWSKGSTATGDHNHACRPWTRSALSLNPQTLNRTTGVAV